MFAFRIRRRRFPFSPPRRGGQGAVQVGAEASGAPEGNKSHGSRRNRPNPYPCGHRPRDYRAGQVDQGAKTFLPPNGMRKRRTGRITPRFYPGQGRAEASSGRDRGARPSFGPGGGNPFDVFPRRRHSVTFVLLSPLALSTLTPTRLARNRTWKIARSGISRSRRLAAPRGLGRVRCRRLARQFSGPGE
jgi:hypothetical protein